jgi:type I site-specific restriction endonuclease
MNKKQLSERGIYTKFITPAIQSAGWQQTQFREEVRLSWKVFPGSIEPLEYWIKKSR